MHPFMKHVLILVFSLVAGMLSAQRLDLPIPPANSEHPDWIDLLYAADPNVYAIDQAIDDWYAKHPFEKTTYTQFYKKWRRVISPYINGEGFVRHPDEESMRQEQWQFQQKLADAKGSPDRVKANWTSLGPFETINDAKDGDQEPVSWQTNIYSFDQSISNPDKLVCGTEGSEIYSSTDYGLSWQCISRNLAINAVLSVEIHPDDPEVIYAGDNNGIFKTLDGGANWVKLLTVSQMGVNDIAVHPEFPQIVMVAAGKGLWRTTDGGQTWSKLFPEACYDLEWKPFDASVAYLLKDDPADKRCTFWRSTDEGASFVQLSNNGWFDGNDPERANIGARMTVTPADPERIYAVLIGQAKAGDNGFIGVYRSKDGGDTWELPNPPAGGPYSSDHPNLAVIGPFDGTGFHQGYYNLSIGASHENADELLVGHLSLWRSTNGGATFSRIGGYGGSLPWIHPDVQEVKCLGKDTWVCTDGGINYSENFFSTHESRKNGITGSDYWGFGQGWNEDVLVGGRYHNGNSGWYETYPPGIHLRLGGGEAPTGYVSPGGGRRAYFSDIGGKVIPATIDQPSVGFPISKSPNELYFAAESSEQVWSPACYNHYYLGKDNQLWKTEDGGSYFEAIHTFDQTDGGKVTQIAICRSQPKTIYLAQRNVNTWSEGWVWRTQDGGITWKSLVLPNGYKRRFLLTVGGEDPNQVWLAYTDGGNGEKVFESMDGGETWTNISSNLLNGEAPASLVHVLGTEGGLFLGTNKSVYYRSGFGQDWTMFNDGLPDVIACNILRPFYRDQKLRLGAYGKGLWETDLPAPFVSLCQPTVDKLIAFCERDTFQFDDYSVLVHDGASWAWTFDGGVPEQSTQRNPKVVYPGPGTYPVTLTITDGNGYQTSGSLTVEVRSECRPDTVPGFALRTSNDGDAAVMPTFEGEPFEELTISAWVKPDGAQASYAGIVIGAYQGSAFGLNVRDNNELGYHWPGGAWWWNSGFTVVSNEWQHVALVMKEGSITLYHNGIGKTHETAVMPIRLDGVSIGRYRDWASRTWKGMIDEVAIWDRALTEEEIRSSMHLTKRLEDEPDLIAYYQFNRESGQETDRVGVRHLEFAGSAYRQTANGPWGGGVSHREVIDKGGVYTFGATGVMMNFPDQATYPDGEVVVSRIHLQPDVLPDADHPVSPHYWVVNNYGNVFFDPIATLEIDRIGEVYPSNETDPSSLELHLRLWNAEGDVWTYWSNGSQAMAGDDGLVQFEGIQDFGQWSIVNTGKVTSVSDPDPSKRSLEQLVTLFPNPSRPGETLTILTDLEGPLQVRAWTQDGQMVLHQEGLTDRWTLPAHWPAGTYILEWSNRQQMVITSVQLTN